MENYLLTQEDIDALSEGGIDMRGVAAGVEANQAEMEFLGTPTSSVSDDTVSLLGATTPAPTVINSQAEAIAETLSPEELAALRVPTGNPPLDMPDVTTSNVDQVLGAGGAQAQAPSGQASLLQTLGMMAPQAVPNDPYENLSKTQRRMLAFAGLSDAGAALQGRQGTNVQGMMKNFTAQSDINRKRQAAQAQQQMLSGIIGKNAADGQGSLASQKQQAMMLLTNPSTVAMGQALLAQIAAEEQRILASTSSVQGSANTIETVMDLMQSVRDNPSATGFWGSILGNIPFTKAGEVRIDADTLRSNMALDALKNLKATGATLGSVSEAELKLLESDIAQLNLSQKQDAVLKDLEKIKKRYSDLIRKAYASGDAVALDAALGGRPSWLNETAPAATPQAGNSDLTADELKYLEGVGGAKE